MSTATIALLAFALGVLAALLWSRRQARIERDAFEYAAQWDEALLTDARAEIERWRWLATKLDEQAENAKRALDVAFAEIRRLDEQRVARESELMLSWGQS